MSETKFSNFLSVWMRRACLVGMVGIGFYFVFDPTVPKLYKLLIVIGVLGFILYFFLGGGGGKGGPLPGGTSRYTVNH